MSRLFCGIPLPELLAQRLMLLQGGVRGARWEAEENLHLTLRFIGDVQGADPQRIGEVLESVRMAPFELTLKGVGHFPPRGQPKILWVGVADEAPVVELHRKIERTLVRTGLEPEGRKFSPHVTLGRLRNPSAPHVAAFLAQHSLFVGDAFAVDRFALYSSVLAPGGSKYRVEQIITLDRD